MLTVIGLAGVFALCAFVGLAVFAGDAAYAANNSVPFWLCVVSALALGFLPPARRSLPSTQDAVITAMVLAIGGYLVFKGIRNGQPSTRVFGIAVALPYIAMTCLLVYYASGNWDGVTSYWLD